MEKKLSEAETQIMDLIWREGGYISSVTLAKRLEQHGMSWKRTTVSTFLSRLCDKGVLKAERSGRSYSYTALLTESEYLGAQAKGFVDSVYGGDAKGLVAALIKNDYLSKSDIAELRDFWQSGGGRDDGNA